MHPLKLEIMFAFGSRRAKFKQAFEALVRYHMVENLIMVIDEKSGWRGNGSRCASDTLIEVVRPLRELGYSMDRIQKWVSP